MEATSEFETAFARRARDVRRALATRQLTGGIAVGTALGVPLVFGAWWLGVRAPWLVGLGGAVLGAGLGLLRAHRKRWSDEAIALYLDGRMGANELIVTTLELGRQGRLPEAVCARAATLIRADSRKRLAPPPWQRGHSVILPLLAVLACTAWLPPRPAPAAPKTNPGSALVRKTLPELEALTALSGLPAATAEQRARLDDAARRARRLRAALEQGLPRREALARLAELRDDIVGERQALGNGANRAGLEAALGALEQLQEARRAAAALGNGDLVAFDSEMQRLANQAETDAREAARDALGEAQRQAAEKGAKDVAGALAEAERAFARRAAESEALRKLAEALGDRLGEDGQAARAELDRSGSAEARQQLAESLLTALEELNDAELRALADRLGESESAPPEGGASEDTLEALADALASPDGKRQLAEMLRQLARSGPSEGAIRSKGLGQAERSLDSAQTQLGVPTPSRNPGRSVASPKGGVPGPGGASDPAPADHSGTTEAVDGPELRAKAEGHLDPHSPLRSAIAGRAQARPGRFAAEVPVEALPAIGASEVGGVQRSNIPEAYRDQVGRYFSAE